MLRLFSRGGAQDFRWIFWPFLFAFFSAILIALFASEPLDVNFVDRFLSFPVALCLVALARGSRPSSRWLLWGVYAAIFQGAAWALWDLFVSDTSRAAGNTHPILFGNLNMLLTLLLILFSALATHKNTRCRLLALILAALPLFTWVSSGSRGSLLAVPVLGILLVLLRKDAWHRGLLVGGVILTLIAGALVAKSPLMQQQLRLSAVGQDLARAQVQDYKTSVGARLVMWEAAWKMFKAHPVVGVGHMAIDRNWNACKRAVKSLLFNGHSGTRTRM